MKLHVYVLRRMLVWPFVAFCVITLTFVLLHTIPGDPVQAIAAEYAYGADPTYVAKMREIYGLDKPVYIQYLRYLNNLLHGNLGDTLVYGRQPVSGVILQTLPATIELTIWALFFALAIGIPLGIISALYRNKILDHISRLIALFGVSMPSFWAGLVFVLIFFYYLGILPSAGRLGFLYTPPPHVTGFYTLDSLIIGNIPMALNAFFHLILPSFTLSLPSIGMVSRLTRSSMLDTLSKDYIRFAKSMGLPERMINYKLALKNALIPTITFMGVAVGAMLGGSVIIETVFSFPGLGSFFVQSMLRKDYFSVLGVVTVLSLIYSTASLVIDVIYGFLDPRIKY